MWFVFRPEKKCSSLTNWFKSGLLAQSQVHNFPSLHQLQPFYRRPAAGRVLSSKVGRERQSCVGGWVQACMWRIVNIGELCRLEAFPPMSRPSSHQGGAQPLLGHCPCRRGGEGGQGKGGGKVLEGETRSPEHDSKIVLQHLHKVCVSSLVTITAKVPAALKRKVFRKGTIKTFLLFKEVFCLTLAGFVEK